jgi:hypothetical protein
MTKQHSENTLDSLPGTFLVSRVELFLQDLRVRQGLRKDFPSRIYAVRLIVKMAELFASNKVRWSNRGERTGKDSVEVRADFKYVEIIVRTRLTKLEMPNPEIEITHRLHPKARFTFLPLRIPASAVGAFFQNHPAQSTTPMQPGHPAFLN